MVMLSIQEKIFVVATCITAALAVLHPILKVQIINHPVRARRLLDTESAASFLPPGEFGGVEVGVNVFQVALVPHQGSQQHAPVI